jgi:hypothetical protein
MLLVASIVLTITISSDKSISLRSTLCSVKSAWKSIKWKGDVLGR